MKLAMIGTGMIVHDFLTQADLLPMYELEVLCGRPHREEEMKELQKQYGIHRLFFSYEEVLKSDVEVVYIGIVNQLHYEYARKALEAGKHVILEKPFTVTLEEARHLAELAKSRHLFLFEAITNQYFPNYHKIRELLPQLGNIKIVSCNYSQYSSRYDRFRAGEVLPAFDPACAGGALMDLNVYNIHFVTGLFGKPVSIHYYPNMERGVDTSGILIMNYPSFQCVCIGAKDCKAPLDNLIQGDKGCICVDSSMNMCTQFRMIKNDGTVTHYAENIYEHRMTSEFLAFADMMAKGDYDACYQMLEHTLMVSEILENSRKYC